MKKIAGSIFVSLIVIVLVIGCTELGPDTNLDTNNPPNPLIDINFGELPDKDLCEFTDTGWQCVLLKNEGDFNYANYDYDDFKDIDSNFKDQCILGNGRYSCVGYCMPFYWHTCDFPFDDVGKECDSSSKCQGICRIENALIEEKFPNRSMYDEHVWEGVKGTCAEYRYEPCNDWWFGVDNGTVKFLGGMLCD